MPSTVKITRPQLRDALRRLQANVTAEELWAALLQRSLSFDQAHAADEQGSVRVTEQGLA